MSDHKNITYSPTPFPAPTSCYRNGPNGELPYYSVASVTHAEVLHAKGKKASDVEIALTTADEWNGSLSSANARYCTVCEKPLPRNARSNQIAHAGDCKAKLRQAQWQEYNKTKRVDGAHVPHICRQCNKEYVPRLVTQATCGQPECRKAHRDGLQRGYREADKKAKVA